jgi:anaerobic selenocysteine-containing dehydrogenase
MTDTARYADVVLPATTSLEHADLYRSYGQYAVQRVKAAVPPQGEAKPNWEVFRLLARAMELDAPVFSLDTEAVIDLVLDASRAAHPAWWEGVDRAALDRGEAVELRPPRAGGWGTASGKIELVSPGHHEPVPHHRPSHADAEADPLPLRLVTAPALNTLNSTFHERPELRARNGQMSIHLAPAEASRRGLSDGARVVAWNRLGEAVFALRVDDGVPEGVAVAPGVHWIEHTPGGRNANALTSQRLTDDGRGSTFYDNRVDVRAG